MCKQTNNTSTAPQGAISEPSTYDILCGKDKLCVNHAGSKRFRVIIESYRERYSHAETKFDKMGITKEIYEGLSSNFSRFLKFNDQLKVWEELQPLAARDKIGHSLRFSNRRKRRNIGSSSSKRKNSSSAISIASSSSGSSSCGSITSSSSRSASPVPCSPPIMDSFDAQLYEIDQHSQGSDSVDSMVVEWMKLSDKDADLMTLQDSSSPTTTTSLLDHMISAATASCGIQHQNQQQRQHERISTQDQWSLLNDSILGEWNDIDTEISRSIFA